MAGNDDEWVLLDCDDEMTLPEAASAVPVPATCASDDAMAVVTAADNAECSGVVAVDASEDDDDEEDAYSDYSNEGRLERAYESDGELDQVDAAEVVTAVAAADIKWSYGDSTDEEDAYSGDDDEDAYSDYSNEGRLERGYESDEDLHQVGHESCQAAFDMRKLPDKLRSIADGHKASAPSAGVYNLSRQLYATRLQEYLHGSGSAYRHGHECSGVAVDDAGNTDDEDDDEEDACSDYSDEGRLERAYESDEDQVDMTKLLVLEKIMSIIDPSKAAPGGGISDYDYGGLSDVDYEILSDPDYGILSDVHWGQGLDWGSLYDFDYGNLDSVDYGSLYDFNYSSARGH
jgi:hypothetical protein